MVTEDYVSLKTAKLLKEKGFDVETRGYYPIKGDATGRLFANSSSEYNHNHSQVQISAPTLQMAMKWLREVHHLFIGCGPRLSFTDFYWITANIYRVRKKSSLYHTEDVDDYSCVASCDEHSYEEACEAAIKYCLESLI